MFELINTLYEINQPNSNGYVCNNILTPLFRYHISMNVLSQLLYDISLFSDTLTQL